MGTSYLYGKNWQQITRDERFFCAHLYFALKANISPLLELLLETGIVTQQEISEEWEVGFEVCFYRDYIHELGYNNIKEIGSTPFSKLGKRTFDLCLFSGKKFIIIEAKSHGGFDTKQLGYFKKDTNRLTKILNTKTEIILLGLCASRYRPKPSTRNHFAALLNWKQMHDLYHDPVFLRAEEVFRR